jgi:hypothetical protein
MSFQGTYQFLLGDKPVANGALSLKAEARLHFGGLARCRWQVAEQALCR